MSTVGKKLRKIPKRKIVSIIGFVLLIVFYELMEYGSRSSSVSREFLILGEHRLPIAMLAGVFSSISTIVLICWVIFFGRVGFYTSIVVLSFRAVKLALGLAHFHASSFPAFFVTIVGFVSVTLIYQRNEKVRKVQARHQKELEEFNRSIIGAFANCIDGKDEYTNGHSFRVALYTRLLAEKLEEPPETVEKMYNIALLHDIGKIGIPDAILNKPGKLTAEEYNIMKGHPQRGYEILKDVKNQEDIAVGARHHHERYDGNGYPTGLKGESIPWVARIIAVADAFDAMSSTRPYRKRISMFNIVKEINRCSGTQFDPKVAEAFMDMYEEGTFRELEREIDDELRQNKG